MTPEEKQKYIEKSKELHHLGFNCAQCVSVALCDLVGLEPDLTFRFMEGLGGGMGAFTQTCGAISGGVAILGYAHSNGIETHDTKMKTFSYTKQLVNGLAERRGSTMCPVLRPPDRNMIQEVCDGYIADCTEMALDLLEQIWADKAAEAEAAKAAE